MLKGWRFVLRWRAQMRRHPRQSLRRLALGRRNAGRQARMETLRRVGERTALPAEIETLGPGARAVLAATVESGSDPVGSPIVILADTAADAASLYAPMVLLDPASPLAVPAFDPAVHNPVGWRRDPKSWIAALGPLRHLPPTATASRTFSPAQLKVLRRGFGVEDVAAFHAGAFARAGTLARLAASGVVVHVTDGDRVLEALLGTRLFGLMAERLPVGNVDRREWTSIRMRRLALRKHASSARARAICEAAGITPLSRPLVSVLMATRRPVMLLRALRNVAKQDYPALELVLALHGDGFDADVVARAVGDLSISVRVVRAGRERPLGAVLNAATAAARGELLTKMDDDDLYDRHHVWDLVLAHQYSGAMLVGKGIEYIYFASIDTTIRRNSGYAECHNTYVSGGTLMIGRRDLEGVGGWRGVPVGEDQAMVEDVLRAGGAVYRTHGTGYLVVRHGQRHAWRLDEDRFRDQAELVRPGWNPALAGIDDEPSFRL